MAESKLSLDWLLKKAGDSIKLNLYSTANMMQPIQVRMKLHVLHLPRGDLEAITESDQEYDSSVSKPVLTTGASMPPGLVRSNTMVPALRRVFSALRAQEPSKIAAAKSKFYQQIESDSEDYESADSL